MMKPISAKSNEELRILTKKAIKARKVLRTKINALIEEAWKLKNGKMNLDWSINKSREELGRRKVKTCKAFKEKAPPEWGGILKTYSCGARELSYNTFRRMEDLFRLYCCTCRWKPTQAQTRMVILRIKNGKAVSE